MKRGCVYIIPDENQILDDCFYREIEKSHLSAIKEFSYYYNLEYEFGKDEYHEAPCMLALDGHLVVKIENTCSNVILYIPEVVTDRQNIWLHNQRENFLNYSTIAGFKLNKEDGIYNAKEMLGLDNIIREADRRNIIYGKRKEEENARKKIQS